MRRRSFLKTAAARPLFLNSSEIFAQEFDLIIGGSRIIDPSLNVDTVADMTK